MASTSPIRLVVGNASHLWSRISSLIELVHFKAELRDLHLLYQVMNVRLSETRLAVFDLVWLIMVQYLLQYRDMIY